MYVCTWQNLKLDIESVPALLNRNKYVLKQLGDQLHKNMLTVSLGATHMRMNTNIGMKIVNMVMKANVRVVPIKGYIMSIIICQFFVLIITNMPY